MIRQIVLILVKNACERMPDGGNILVDAGVLVHRDGAMYTVLTVSDTGAGSTKTLQAQLYEPLPDRKTGDRQTLYLSFLSDLVDKMDGHLKVNASASGTQFDILLPCARQAESGSKPPHLLMVRT
jgi:nitrogen-specific signal transduction histidine kinase